MSGAAAEVRGIGLVTPAGSTVDDLWRVVVAAEGTLAEVVRLDGMEEVPALVCPASGFDPSTRLERHEVRRLDRSHQMAIWAADDAIAQAGDGPAAARCAVVVGVGFGAASFYDAQQSAFARNGYRAVSPLAIPVIMPNSIAAHLSIRYGYQGPSITVSSACASGTMAIGEALWLLRADRADRVLVGGVDALNTASVVAPFMRMEAMSTRFDVPSRSSRPFTVGRDGFVLGEGAGFFVLERHQQLGGLGRVLGYATNSDAHHIVAPPEHGEPAAACMAAALLDAGVDADDVGHVNAHGTSTSRNDLAEAQAIAAAIGRRLPVTSTKGVIGHLIGAAGAVELIVALESVRRATIPPTANADEIDPVIDGLIDVVTEPARSDGPVAVSNSFGFGGHNASLVVAP